MSFIWSARLGILQRLVKTCGGEVLRSDQNSKGLSQVQASYPPGTQHDS